jgi:predicted nuclease with RNAse H fold
VAADRWAGVDVRGARKGFHSVVLDPQGVVAGPENHRDASEVVVWLEQMRPSVVAADSPRSAAPQGASSRAGERRLNREVCGIRWTPDRDTLDEGSPYYDWIRRGLELYAALEDSPQCRWEVIEVFPTASWTVWAGPRGARRRAAWTRAALDGLALPGLPKRRLNQDDRDAIAAALTARLHAEGRCRAFDEIVAPRTGCVGPGGGRRRR